MPFSWMSVIAHVRVCVCVQVEGEAAQELQSLHDAVYDQALVWVNSLKPEQKERIEGHFGPMPEKDSEIQVYTHTHTHMHAHTHSCTHTHY